MRLYVGLTDNDWFDYLARRPGVDEVNFWRPGGTMQFRALQPGEFFLFKLHAPDNVIAGGAFFAHSSLVPMSLAWEAFEQNNGVPDLAGLRRKIWAKRKPEEQGKDVTIGVTLLVQPFFFPRSLWIPHRFEPGIQSGKTYDAAMGDGAALLAAVRERLGGFSFREDALSTDLPLVARDAGGHPGLSPRYGAPIEIRPRLGQGTFRIAVTDAYDRRCAITGERTLPVLEAAHIRPYAEGGIHDVANGLLLRSDLHTLFDRGYVSVTPEAKVLVSRRIKEEFSNGRDYYALDGRVLRPPTKGFPEPERELLRWHNNERFLG